mgnify:CR=1 FL=1
MENRNVAECIVAKNRHGETGKVPLRWTPEYLVGTAELAEADNGHIQLLCHDLQHTGDVADRLLAVLPGGLNKSDLILLAARPGVGKSSFAMNMALNVARQAQKTVAVFSLEMSKEQLLEDR